MIRSCLIQKLENRQKHGELHWTKSLASRLHFVILWIRQPSVIASWVASVKPPPEPKQASMHLVLFPHRVAHASQSRRILEMRKCIKSCNLIDHHVLICTQKNMTSRVSPSTNQQTLRASARYTILVCPIARWRFFSGWKAAPGQDKGTGTQIMDNAWQHLKRYSRRFRRGFAQWPCYPKIGIHEYLCIKNSLVQCLFLANYMMIHWIFGGVPGVSPATPSPRPDDIYIYGVSLKIGCP
jgi:hypothetical protein